MSVIAAKLAGLKERRWGRKLVHKEWPRLGTSAAQREKKEADEERG